MSERNSLVAQDEIITDKTLATPPPSSCAV